MMPQTYKYDLYLSYSPQESKWVRDWLLPRLEGAGLRVFVDFRDARPGAAKITEMERAMLESAKTLLVLTPAYLQGDWNDFQSIMIQYLDPAGRQQRLIPLILKAVDLPLRLNMLVPLDFAEMDQRDEQVVRLLGAFGKEGKRREGEDDREVELIAQVVTSTPISNPVVKKAMEVEQAGFTDFDPAESFAGFAGVFAEGAVGAVCRAGFAAGGDGRTGETNARRQIGARKRSSPWPKFVGGGATGDGGGKPVRVYGVS